VTPVAHIAVRIELSQLLAPRLADAHWRTALKDALCGQIGALATALGVPGDVAVELAEASAEGTSAMRCVRVQVGERSCRFTQEQMARAYSLACGDVLAAATQAQLTAWLQANDAAPLILSLAREAIARDPSVLLGPEQLARIVPHELPPNRRQRMTTIAHMLLSLGISIEGLAARAELEDPALNDEEAAEALIGALKGTTVDIHLSQAELRRVSLAAGDAGGEKFTMLRDGLFYETGFRFPDLRFVVDDSLGSHRFAFTVNAVRGLPWVGLGDDEYLVNDSAALVAATYHTTARPAANPNTGAPFAVASSLPSGRGHTTWPAFDYMVLCLSVELRRLAPRLLDRATVTRELDRLAGAFPTLVRAARGRITAARLTRVLRALLEEGQLIRDLRSLLAAIVDLDTIVADASAYIVVDDRLPVMTPPGEPPPVPLLVAAIRTAQRRYITHKHTGGTWSLAVVLLDPALEREIRERDARGVLLDDVSWCDGVLDAIDQEMPAWGESARPPCLLTTVDTRDALRRLVALEAPHWPVLSYPDLAPDAQLSVKSRIAAPK
jgi:flagellar biosynthesis component FlhA